MTSIITTIISIALPSILSFLIWQLKRTMITREKDNLAIKAGIKTLLKSKMCELHKEYVARGCINSNELAGFIEIYNDYHNLNGNGTGTIWMRDVEELPRKE